MSVIRVTLCALVCIAWASHSQCAEPAPTEKIRLLAAKDVRIDGWFWGPKLAVYREKTIPHSWQYVAGEIRALQKAAGQHVQGDLNGTWGEANLYKFMETVAHSLGTHPDSALEKRMDEIIALVGAAQRKDGYAHAYIVNSGKPPWDPAFLDGSHDGYVLGHMIEAALEYHANTGKRNFLDIACKAADQAYEHFLGKNGQPGFCGHAELELALVELYRVVPEPRYLELSKAFIEWRGRGKVKPAGPTPREYFQDGQPLCQQRTLEGHAVRAVFFATGVADVAIETGDSDYRLAANRFWDSTTLRRMTVTGSIGPRKEHEAFGEDYELPDNGYYESCAACGLADFAQRMFMLERQAESADVLERTLYNAILHGISLDGVTSYYGNPLSDRDNPRYNSWVCCPPNLSRTLFQVGRYAYAYSDSAIYVNLFVAGSATLPLKAGAVKLNVATEYPW
ncbi:MAG: glycoside hydrolase family 127 protein, partial [Tepidisphaerales bacterium]